MRRVNHGIASFCVFLVFLFIRALLARNRPVDTTRWLTWGVKSSIVGVVAIVGYAWVFGEVTVGAGDFVYLAGLWRNASWVEQNRALIGDIGGSNRELFAAMPRRHYEQAWPLCSRLAAYALVQTFYIVSIVALFGRAFCFWEGVLSVKADQRNEPGARLDQSCRRKPMRLERHGEESREAKRAPFESGRTHARQELQEAGFQIPPGDDGDDASSASDEYSD